MVAQADELRAVPLFAELDEAALAALCAAGQRTVHPSGAWTMDAQFVRESVFVLVAGSVHLYRCSPHGARITIAIKQAGDPFDLYLGGHPGASRDLVETGTDGAVTYAFARTWLTTFARVHVSVALGLLQASAALVSGLRDVVEDLGFYGVDTRVARALVRLSAATTLVVMTRENLATVVCASREETGKALRRLRAQGLIHYVDRQPTIYLCDKEALASLQNSCM